MDKAARALCGSMSQLAVFRDCQMPFRSGFPAAVLGMAARGACPETGRAVIAANAPAAAVTTAIATCLTAFGIVVGLPDARMLPLGTG